MEERDGRGLKRIWVKTMKTSYKVRCLYSEDNSYFDKSPQGTYMYLQNHYEGYSRGCGQWVWLLTWSRLLFSLRASALT